MCIFHLFTTRTFLRLYPFSAIVAIHTTLAIHQICRQSVSTGCGSELDCTYFTCVSCITQNTCTHSCTLLRVSSGLLTSHYHHLSGHINWLSSQTLSGVFAHTVDQLGRGRVFTWLYGSSLFFFFSFLFSYLLCSLFCLVFLMKFLFVPQDGWMLGWKRTGKF